MTAFNAVCFRVKPGKDEAFIEAHRRAERNWAGMRRANIIKTGERSYCIIAEWSDMDALAATVVAAAQEISARIGAMDSELDLPPRAIG